MPNTNDQQMDPTTAYTDLDPAQRATIAQAFIDRFSQYDDPGAREYARVDPHFVSPNQLVQMHQYAADMHPEALADVMRQPDIASALGGFAAHEAQEHHP
jgi:hypothetical protein